MRSRLFLTLSIILIALTVLTGVIWVAGLRMADPLETLHIPLHEERSHAVEIWDEVMSPWGNGDPMDPRITPL
jgi:hypothetical protein